MPTNFSKFINTTNLRFLILLSPTKLFIFLQIRPILSKVTGYSRLQSTKYCHVSELTGHFLIFIYKHFHVTPPTWDSSLTIKCMFGGMRWQKYPHLQHHHLQFFMSHSPSYKPVTTLNPPLVKHTNLNIASILYITK